MTGIRRQVSLLLSAGHAAARRYPIGMVFMEAQFVVERHNREEATRAMLIQLAAGSMLSKDSAREFAKQIKKMTQG